MMDINHLVSRKVLVAGLGVTGRSVVRFLLERHVPFDVAEGNSIKDQELTELFGSYHPTIHREFSARVFCDYDVIVLSPGIARAHPAVCAAIDKGVQIIGDIELFAASVREPVIAVTGSNGKSTVVAWLEDALCNVGIRAIGCGNIGKAALDALSDQADLFILELSSYQLESTYSLRPLVAVVLNVSEDHMDRYPDIEQYAAVKRQIYAQAHYKVANYDDQRTWPETDRQSVHWFTLKDHEFDGEGSVSGRDLDTRRFALPGTHNKANALAIIVIYNCLTHHFGHSFAVPVESFIDSLARFTGLPHRGQLIVERDGVRWYNDSKGTNIDACEKAITAMPGPVILIAGGQGKGADFTQLRDVVSHRVRYLILIGEDKQTIATALAGCSEIAFCQSLQQAVALAHRNACSGDAVLLSPACASFDMFKSFVDRGEQFVAAVHQELAA